MNRLPIRLRVTLVFAAVTALALAAASLGLYALMRRGLDEEINRALAARTADFQRLVTESDEPLARQDLSPGARGGPAQVLDLEGRLLAGSPDARDRALLSAKDLGGDLTHVRTFDRSARGGERVRLEAAAFPLAGRTVVAVVGTSLDERDDALDRLRALLLIGGPLALLLGTTGGYLAASLGFRPVERMRISASRMSGTDPGLRLPVPRSEDEIQRLAVTLNELLERSDHALERERRFVSDASHELRTPIAVLKAELDLAKAADRSPVEVRRAVGSASDECDRLARLANDLLVLSRLHEGRLPVRPEELDADDLMRSVARRFAHRANAAGRAVRVEVGPPVVFGADRLRVEQALTNMVDNALAHGAGDVTLRCFEVAGGVELHVTDGGRGFPPGFADRAFERFARGEAGRATQGAGLGLSIVQAVALSHGGSAHVEEGPPTDVWMSIPRPTSG